MEVSFPSPVLNHKLITTLCYDDEEIRPVPTMKDAPPLQSKIYFNETFTRVSIECRINALSSQHKDSLFRVRLTAAAIDGSFFVEISSSPIFVVSKHAQALKMLHRNDVAPSKPSPREMPSMDRSIDASSDAVLETLRRMEERQLSQQRQLDALLRVPDPKDVDFDEAFERFLSAYRKVPLEDRPAKLRRVSQKNGCFVEMCSVVSHMALEADTGDWGSLYSEIFLDSSPDAT